MVLVAVSCDKVDDMSLNGELFTQIYPTEECTNSMRFKKNTVTITYAECKLYKDNWVIRSYDSTYSYSYKNGRLIIDGKEVLSYEDDKITLSRGGDTYIIYQKTY